MATEKKHAETLTKVTWGDDGKATIQVVGHPALTFDPKKASAANRAYAEKFGWDNRIKNKTSVTADKATGKVDQAEKFALAKALVEFYEAGGEAWEMKSGARQTGPDIGLLVRALIELGLAKDVDGANAQFQALALSRKIDRDGAIALLWTAKDVAIKVNEIRTRERTYSHDATSLLAEMNEAE